MRRMEMTFRVPRTTHGAAVVDLLPVYTRDTHNDTLHVHRLSLRCLLSYIGQLYRKISQTEYRNYVDAKHYALASSITRV